MRISRRTFLKAAFIALYRRELYAEIPAVSADPSIFSYSKALRRRSSSIADFGEPDSAAYAALIRALDSRDSSAWQALSIHGEVGSTSKPSPLPALTLYNPLARPSIDFNELSRNLIQIPPPPEMHGDVMAAEMAELYWMALLRDTTLTQDRSGHTAGHTYDEAWRDLTTRYPFFKSFYGPGRPLPRERLFRAAVPGNPAAFPGVGDGPWLSQFLLSGSAKALIAVPVIADPAQSNYLADTETWRDIQSGVNPTGKDRTAARVPQFARTGRDIARLVQGDQGFPELRIALSLLTEMQPERKTHADLFEPWFAGIMSQALQICFYHKWYRWRRIRPEEYGGRVHFSLTDHSARSRYALPSLLLESARGGVLEYIQEHNRLSHDAHTYLLPQAYPEGCPTHPAYPASHATVMGAGVTLLKALFDSKKAMSVSGGIRIPSEDGASLITLRESSAIEAPTIGGELNKLASNISFGRSFAGLHYRSDNVHGLLLGEQVALGYLRAIQAKPHPVSLCSSTDFLGRLVFW